MSRSVLALLTCAAACSTPATLRPALPPAPTKAPIEARPVEPAPRQALRPSVNLTGTWMTGSAYEPTARSTVVQLQCSHTPGFWLVKQSGDTVRAWTMPAQESKGTASHEESSSSSPVEGRIAGDVVTLPVDGARYLLRYDAASGHLRGTLDGAPFWAMRVQLIRAEGCLPPP